MEMSAAAPRVSVVMACYNLGRYLDEAVESVLAQTFQDFEIVIVNDGSSDPETNALLARYERPKTRVIEAPHRGASAARNLGVAEARGELVTGFDCDDVLDPTFLEKTVRVLDETPNVGFVSCYVKTFGEESWEWKRDELDLVTMLGECTALGPSLIRRAVFLDAGGYDESLGEIGDEDWELFISITERGWDGAVVPETLYHYRRRSGSLSTVCDRPENHRRVFAYLLEKHRASYERHVLDVLVNREAEACTMRKVVLHYQKSLAAVVPRLEAAREERDRLARKLEAARHRQREAARADDLERRLEDERRRSADRDAALAEAYRQAADREDVLAETRRRLWELENSKTWRLTYPVRMAYWQLVQRRRRPPS
jgi:glycosyltransferase involved in cell wall biosynthesis